VRNVFPPIFKSREGEVVVGGNHQKRKKEKEKERITRKNNHKSELGFICTVVPSHHLHKLRSSTRRDGIDEIQEACVGKSSSPLIQSRLDVSSWRCEMLLFSPLEKNSILVR
jgi:hypothetical protein